MRIALLLLCLVAPAASAALHKCVAGDGRASYQSSPCARGHRTEWVREAAPEAAREPVAISVPVPVRVKPPVRVRGSGARPVPSRCEQVRRAADEARERDWNRLTFRQRSELDAKVARACSKQ